MPDITRADAQQIAFEHFSCDCSTTKLESEWGGTFKLSTKEGQNYLLKVAPHHVLKSRIELEVAAISHLMHSDVAIAFPRIVKSVNGSLSVETELGTARMFEWVEGRLWHEANPHSPRLLSDLGEKLAGLKALLDRFDHPAAHFTNDWSPNCVEWMSEYIDLMPSENQDIIRDVLHSSAKLIDLITSLPKAVNYNDANDHNIIVSRIGSPPTVTGFIDFGDLHYGPRINDLAICLAYAMMRKPDPIGAAVYVIEGFHKISRLSEDELRCVMVLVKSRLAISIIHAAIRAQKDPDNAYWQVSAADATQLLSILSSYSEHLALCRFRHVCGLEPSPKSSQLKTWLTQNRPLIGAVTEFDLTKEAVEVFDWSVGSVEMGGINDIENVHESTRNTFKQMKAAGVRVGIGRYDEPRAVYSTSKYAIPGNNGPEMRTIHIGVDIFIPVGSPLYAPLDGTVFAIVDDAGDKEYGPLVILEHKPEPDLTFYTLYGHNSLSTLDFFVKGDHVRRGQQIAFVGDYPENGNWVPHSHFQIITDMLGYTEDFPGVALASQREIWLSLCPDPNLILGISDPCMKVEWNSAEDLLKQRLNVLGSNLSVSHNRPLHIVRGWKSNLYTANGTSYLDTRNNIAHVGHEHPRIVNAGRKQMAVLNTNTRYLNRTRIELAERLLNTLPENLERIYFVNSGSEANDLALRMARNHLHSNETLVMDQGYHGATSACIEVSSYKFDGRGGTGRMKHIHVLPNLQTTSQNSTREAMNFAITAQANNGPMTFIHEALPGSGGQIVPPADYFTSIYDVMHHNGGLCIADEVQTGIGRVGQCFWSFEIYGINPDIVTIGKPLGNGHPIAAVAVSNEIANSFDNGMEFFSSFGGNPVSVAIGLEVLNVVRDEALQTKASEIGNHWMNAIKKLMANHPIISDVRGYGLFFGIEFLLPNNTEHLSDVCAYIQNRMSDHHILTSFDGPKHNVMKIKPPMCISRPEVDYFLHVFQKILSEDMVNRTFGK